MFINIYCDESCHLQNDGINTMGLGAIWCPFSELKKISSDIKHIKINNNIQKSNELKWVKVSQSKLNVYKELINYFFNNPYLNFRALIVRNKNQLNHELFKQTHDDWYYKMYYEMLKPIFCINNNYEIYIDIKDTKSYIKQKKLNDVCCNYLYDFHYNIIKKIQPIRSDEVQIMQLVDIILGAIVYQNREFNVDHTYSPAKLELIKLIKEHSKSSLENTSALSNKKFNLFFWSGKQNV